MWSDSLNVQGYFKIDSYNINGELIDTYEHKNMIMDNGRINMCTFMSGYSGSSRISKLVLGTQGHGISLLDPKTEADGFVSSRDSLFSEDTSSYEYNILINPTTNGQEADIIEDDSEAGSKIIVTQNGNLLTYEIEIAGPAANNGSSVPYTEAGFYAGTSLFAMRCFPVRVKDSTTKFIITWSFQF
jgi:hypothetical protein